jgi:IclR family acetate operon transcriptional repressor
MAGRATVTADDSMAVRSVEPRTQIRSVRRAMRLLFEIAERADGATATELAHALDIPVPTAYHLLNTLVVDGMLARDPRRRYVLGPRVGALTDAVACNLAVPHFLADPLRALAQDTGETAYLTAWRRREITVLDCVEGARAVKVSGLHPGFYAHAHARAGGKLLLAHAPGAVREDYLSRHPLVAVTGATIVDPARFAEELARIRRRGFAVDVEEFAEGVGCLAVPVTEGGGVLAAYTLSAPLVRFEHSFEELRRSALRSARSVAAHARGGGGGDDDDDGDADAAAGPIPAPDPGSRSASRSARPRSFTAAATLGTLGQG